MTSMPAMQVGWILFSLVSGGLYFEEFRGFDALQWGMFSTGVVGVVAGVVCICAGGARGAVRRVSTVYDMVGVEGQREGGRRRCMTAHCHVAASEQDLERSDGVAAVDAAARRRNRTL